MATTICVCVFTMFFVATVVCFVITCTYNFKASALREEADRLIKNKTADSSSPEPTTSKRKNPVPKAMHLLSKAKHSLSTAEDLEQRGYYWFAAGFVVGVIFLLLCIVIATVYTVEYASSSTNRVHPTRDMTMPEFRIRRTLGLSDNRQRPVRRQRRISTIYRRPRERNQPYQPRNLPAADVV